MKIDEVERVLFVSFPRLRRHRSFVRHCLEWHGDCQPRPNFYFRWHLPRFVATCEFLDAVLHTTGDKQILDVGAFPPFAILMNHFLEGKHPSLRWTRTGFHDEVVHYSSQGSHYDVPLVRCVLGDEPLPFESGKFDVVLLTEVIEHVDVHPQLLLAEMNRVLSREGTLLLTTPNASSLKKLLQLSNGVPQYDSPTFGSFMGHRYEYSYYDIRTCLIRSAFAITGEEANNVYFNDPRGIVPAVELALSLFGKLVTGQPGRAAKLYLRRGSTLFFSARKTGDVARENIERLRI